MKKLKYFLQLYDGIWSVPLAFLIFVLVGFILGIIGAAGSYDLAFIQPVFLAVSVVVCAANASILGMRFCFKGFYRWLYGTRNEGQIIMKSKETFKHLLPWQQFAFVLFIFFAYFFSIIMVYLSLV